MWVLWDLEQDCCSIPNRVMFWHLHCTGACIEGACEHPRARNWVLCDVCHVYFHCLCVSVSYKLAQKDNFVITAKNFEKWYNDEIARMSN